MGRNIRIRVARTELNMTQKELAEAVGISRQTMNAIEQGDYNPTIKLCRVICRALGKSLDELFGEEDDTMYCEKCRMLFSDTHCPGCGSRVGRAPEANDLCFLTEQDQVWSGMLEDVLKQNGIPVFTRSSMGAGMALKAGGMFEQIRFYVPFSRFEEAEQLVKELFSGSEEE